MTFEQRLNELTLRHLEKLHALQIEEQQYRTEQARLQLEATRLIIKEQRKEGMMA